MDHQKGKLTVLQVVQQPCDGHPVTGQRGVSVRGKRVIVEGRGARMDRASDSLNITPRSLCIFHPPQWGLDGAQQGLPMHGGSGIRFMG